MAKATKGKRTSVFRDRKCVICKKMFKPNGPTTSVCSEECSAERKSAYYKSKKSGATACDICGHTFQKTSANAKYCSKGCSFVAKRNSQAKAYKKAKATSNGATSKSRRDIDKLVAQVMERHTVGEVGMIMECFKIRIREILLGMER